MAGHVELTETEVKIIKLSVPNRDSVAFLSKVDEADRVAVVRKAVEVGLFCLERGQNAGDVEFVKRQVAELLGSVEKAVGKIPEETQRAILAKIGSDDGQVLSPVTEVVNQAKAETERKIKEVRDLLSNEIDPSKSTSTLGLALSAVKGLLDPTRTDSVQYRIEQAVNQVAQPNGSLAETVKRTVGDAIKPLQDEFNRFTQGLHGAEMVAEAMAGTTAKGPVWEDEVTVVLQQWAKMSGNSCEHVGADNQPGDFVVVVQDGWATAGPLRIVIEARDRQNAVGRQKIAQDLEPKFRERQAHVGIYVSKSQAGLAKEIGDWAEGQCNSGPWVACVGDHLITAIRFAIAQHRIKEMKQSQPEVDAGSIRGQVEAIRTSIRRIRTIKTKATNITQAAADIELESESLRKEVEGHLVDVEEALKKAAKPPMSVPAVASEEAVSVV